MLPPRQSLRDACCFMPALRNARRSRGKWDFRRGRRCLYRSLRAAFRGRKPRGRRKAARPGGARSAAGRCFAAAPTAASAAPGPAALLPRGQGPQRLRGGTAPLGGQRHRAALRASGLAAPRADRPLVREEEGGGSSGRCCVPGASRWDWQAAPRGRATGTAGRQAMPRSALLRPCSFPCR